MSEGSVLDELPGELMMWVLIVSELLVFGAGLAVFMAVRLTDAQGFDDAQGHLNRGLAGLNTLILVSSGYLAATAVERLKKRRAQGARELFAAAAMLGVAFLAIKFHEYGVELGWGIGPDTHPFYMFYFLLTGFHAAHVAAGIIILALLAIMPRERAAEAGVAFWHMVDLVWVLLFPVVYVL